MARVSIALQLTNINQATPEGVQVFAKDNQWQSPGGGWLPLQNGVWNQLPEGLYLMDPQDALQFVLCLGCIFDTCTEGDSGQTRYPQSGDVGSWKVVATNP